MSVEFLDRVYKSPLWLASGTFGWGVEAYQGGFFPMKGAGALITKGVSPQPMEGAPQPRVAELNGVGLLNAIGLQNPGVDYFIQNYMPAYRDPDWPAPVWVNVFADRIDGFCEVISKICLHMDVGDLRWLAGFEINVSCPNVDKGGAEFGTDIKLLSELVRRCQAVSPHLPLMVKLSPMANPIQDFAKAAVDNGARALSVSNTLLAGFPLPETQTPQGIQWSLGRRYGGLSGPALKPLALRLLDQVARVVSVPLCGVGGVQNAHDVKEYFSAGATVVQIGTSNFANPWICDDLFEVLHEIK